MSANYHRDSIPIMQRATELRALRKLLAKVQEIRPSIITEAWECLDLDGHPCHICKEHVLEMMNPGAYECPGCRTVVEK